MELPLRGTDDPQLSALVGALAALAGKMQPHAVADIAKGLAAALENPHETNFDPLLDFVPPDDSRILNLAQGLAALADKMQPQVAAEIAEGLAVALEYPRDADPDRLLSLGLALAALAGKIQPQAAAEIVRQGAQCLVAALDNQQETDSEWLLGFGQALATFCRFLPSAHHTSLLALSNLLLQPVSGEKKQSYDRRLLAEVCAQLGPEDLAAVLKYPFCTGEAEQIVLGQLKAKTQREFGGDVWKFVEQADSLGIKDIDGPTKRPSMQEALNELNELQLHSNKSDGQ